MKDLMQSKSLVAFAFLVLAALFLYNTIAGTGGSDTASTTAVGSDLVKISESLSSATLSKDLFSQSGYRLLNDFSLPLPTDFSGRANPFAPLGQ